MNAIRFETKSYNGIIRIPPEYAEFSDKDVQVIVLIREEEAEHRADTYKDAPLFKAAAVSTKGFKFDRNEANEH